MRIDTVDRSISNGRCGSIPAVECIRGSEAAYCQEMPVALCYSGLTLVSDRSPFATGSVISVYKQFEQEIAGGAAKIVKDDIR